MKKIYESPLNGWGESAERIHVYELENEDEYWELQDMNFDELCDLVGMWEENNVPPGATYHRYTFTREGTHLTVSETIALNV
jgi:hypothetical protein